VSLGVMPNDSSLPPAVVGPAFLQDGTEVWVRPVQPADRDLVERFLGTVSLDALEERYFPAIRSPRTLEERPVPPTAEDRLCLLVLGESGRSVSVLGAGEYVRTAERSTLAEVAFLVAEPYRGLGIASLLLARLARAARTFGVARFVARVRSENPEMLEVFRSSGFPFTEQRLADEVDVVFPIVPREGPAPAPRPLTPGRHPRHRTVRHALA
jgi:GNAT superfamily N-acetyltransferase